MKPGAPFRRHDAPPTPCHCHSLHTHPAYRSPPSQLGAGGGPRGARLSSAGQRALLPFPSPPLGGTRETRKVQVRPTAGAPLDGCGLVKSGTDGPLKSQLQRPGGKQGRKERPPSPPTDHSSDSPRFALFDQKKVSQDPTVRVLETGASEERGQSAIIHWETVPSGTHSSQAAPSSGHHATTPLSPQCPTPTAHTTTTTTSQLHTEFKC